MKLFIDGDIIRSGSVISQNNSITTISILYGMRNHPKKFRLKFPKDETISSGASILLSNLLKDSRKKGEYTFVKSPYTDHYVYALVYWIEDILIAQNQKGVEVKRVFDFEGRAPIYLLKLKLDKNCEIVLYKGTDKTLTFYMDEDKVKFAETYWAYTSNINVVSLSSKM